MAGVSEWMSEVVASFGNGILPWQLLSIRMTILYIL